MHIECLYGNLEYLYDSRFATRDSVLDLLRIRDSVRVGPVFVTVGRYDIYHTYYMQLQVETQPRKQRSGDELSVGGCYCFDILLPLTTV